MKGELKYRQFEVDGSITAVSNSIAVPVYLGTPGSGAPAPPTYDYSVALRPAGERYSVTVPISQALAAGETDRFLFTMGADKSSFHEFSLLLRYNGREELRSGPISLEIFRPRTDPTTHVTEMERGDEVAR